MRRHPDLVVGYALNTDGFLKGKQFADGLAFEGSQLQKWFKMGDHVKVIAGTNHVGETGLVVRVGRGVVAERAESFASGDRPRALSIGRSPRALSGLYAFRELLLRDSGQSASS